MISKVEACKQAKKRGSIGSFIAIIGIFLLTIIFVCLILIYVDPVWGPLIYDFLTVWGWVIGIIGFTLGSAGWWLRRKERLTCSII